MELLLDAGADANTRWSRQGWKPLHAVAKRGDVRCIELLVSRGGADLDVGTSMENGAIFMRSGVNGKPLDAASLRTVEVGQWEADHLNTDHSLGVE